MTERRPDGKVRAAVASLYIVKEVTRGEPRVLGYSIATEWTEELDAALAWAEARNRDPKSLQAPGMDPRQEEEGND